MKLSRSRSSLESVVRSMVILEPDAKVPSAFRANEPFAPVAVRTASDGRLTPTSCSRTRIVAFDLSVMVHDAEDDAVVAAVVAAEVAVAVGGALATAGVAAPPQATANIPTMIGAAMERGWAGADIGGWLLPMVTGDSKGGRGEGSKAWR